jgi:hypothetical protein
VKKRRSPKEIIESDSRPDLENMWAKHPSKELKEISGRRSKRNVSPNYDYASDWNKEKDSRYMEIHTHPYSPADFWGKFLDKINKILPGRTDREAHRYFSPNDVIGFLARNKAKSAAVYARNPKTGKTYGFVIMKKTKDTPSSTEVAMDDYLLEKAKKLDSDPNYYSEKDAVKMLQDFAERYSFAYRRIDENGKTVESYRPKIGKLQRGVKDLERKAEEFDSELSRTVDSLAAASITSFLTSLIFISSNITGNAIAGFNATATNITGTALFLVALITGTIYLNIKTN